MAYSRDTLARIVERSSTIAERLGDAFIDDVDAVGVENRLAKWRETISPDGDTQFERRLTWDGLALDDVRRRLGDARLADPTALPGWTTVLDEVAAVAPALRDALRAAGDAIDQPFDRVLRAGEPLPFEDILLPIVRVARARLAARIDLDPALVEDTAVADLERALLLELVRVCSETLYIELSVRRAAVATRVSVAGGLYAAFRDAMLAGSLAELFVRYPVLARLVCTRVEYWVDGTVELLGRLAADAEAIAEVLAGGRRLDSVTHVTGGMGDSHRGGRSVRILTFADGTRVVYKPRPILTEDALGRLVAHLNQQLSTPLRTPRCVTRDDYGWVEFIAAESCVDVSAVERYHTRVGMVLALAYALGASDLHHENLVASGEHPVLIDLEVLPASPASLDPRQTSTGERFTNAMWESVLRTALLPIRDRKRRLAEFGGFVRPQGPSPKRLTWTAINSDWMSRREEVSPFGGTATNVPHLDGEPIAPDAFAERVLAGFREMYDALTTHRDVLLAPGAPIETLRHARSRVVLRDTSLYGTLIRRASHPTLLESGVDRCIALEVVRRGGLRHPELPTLWATYRLESEWLFNLDVPYFSTVADETDLSTEAGDPIARYTDRSGYDRMLTRLAGFGSADRERQVALIHVALRAHGLRRERRRADAEITIVAPAPADEGLTRDGVLTEARRLGGELRSAAMESDAGWWWTGITHDIRTKDMWLDDTGPSLGHGAAGIALFFAALYRVGKDDADAEAARRALGSVAPRDGRVNAGARAGDALGMAMGTGGMIYALTTVGRWLHDARLIADAQRLAASIDPAAVRDDVLLDAYGGVAGLLLSLLSLDSGTSSPEAIALAVACGDHLLASRQRDVATGRMVWRTIEDYPTTGFAHGSSGIAYALMRLHHRTGQREFLDGALEAIAFEDQLFVPTRHNWLEASQQLAEPVDDASVWCTWCHGATGIGLSRIGALQWGVGDTTPELGPRLTADLETAVHTTLGRDLGGADHLCCGNFGRVAMLADAARLTGDDAALSAAHDIAWRAVVRSREAGVYGMSTDTTFTPGLLQGVAGVGYELLRLAEPRRLAPVLLFS